MPKDPQLPPRAPIKRTTTRMIVDEQRKAFNDQIKEWEKANPKPRPAITKRR